MTRVHYCEKLNKKRDFIAIENMRLIRIHSDTGVRMHSSDLSRKKKGSYRERKLKKNRRACPGCKKILLKKSRRGYTNFVTAIG